MKIEDYISSGILESYLLGELDENDRAMVERMEANHAEIKTELEQIAITLEIIYQKTAVSPPGYLKDQIQKKSSLAASNAQSLKIASESSGDFGYMIAASISIAILTSLLAFYFYHQWQSTKHQLQDVIAQHQEVADNYQLVNQQLNTLNQAVEVFKNPEYIRVLMKGTTNAPSSLATVYWNDHTREVYLHMHSLQKLSSDKQYQLWAIVEGKPVDIGVFDHADQLIKMQSIGRAAAFAVTIEPKGGSATPTLETMQVIGYIG